MLGISLAPALLTERPKEEAHKALLNAYGGITSLLADLKNRGIGSIEVRTLAPDSAPEEIALCLAPVVAAGMYFSIHTALSESVSAAHFFESFRAATERMPQGQSSVCLVVHMLGNALAAKENRAATVIQLKKWAKYALQENLPVRFALENSRKKGVEPIAGECASVLSAVEEIDLENVGICFDFGHFYYNSLNKKEEMRELPTDSFAKRVIHTHIHGLYENNTHFPLTGENLPLEAYCYALHQNGYRGIYHLEPEFERSFGKFDLVKGINESVEHLKRVSESPR